MIVMVRPWSGRPVRKGQLGAVCLFMLGSKGFRESETGPDRIKIIFKEGNQPY